MKHYEIRTLVTNVSIIPNKISVLKNVFHLISRFSVAVIECIHRTNKIQNSAEFVSVQVS